MDALRARGAEPLRTLSGLVRARRLRLGINKHGGAPRHGLGSARLIPLTEGSKKAAGEGAVAALRRGGLGWLAAARGPLSSMKRRIGEANGQANGLNHHKQPLPGLSVDTPFREGSKPDDRDASCGRVHESPVRLRRRLPIERTHSPSMSGETSPAASSSGACALPGS